jgi:hypothetical protein
VGGTRIHIFWNCNKPDTLSRIPAIALFAQGSARRCVIIIIAVGQDCVTILEIRLKMTKESDARENIDRLLGQAGWSVCDAARAMKIDVVLSNFGFGGTKERWCSAGCARLFCGNIKIQDATTGP